MERYHLSCLVFLVLALTSVLSGPSPSEYLDTDFSAYYTCNNFNCYNGGYCDTRGYGVAYCVCPAGYSGNKCQYKTAHPPSIENLRCNSSCGSTTSCRICQQCDSCGFESMCLTYEALINDLDTECHAQGFEEAILIKTTSSPIGFDKLRCLVGVSSLECPGGSVCVDTGRMGGVCCRSRVGIDRILHKPGSCPPTTNTQLCGRQACSGDIDCAGNLKCCQQCGNRCTNPYADPCVNVKCSNGGRCFTRGLVPNCECPQGYNGQYCERRLDACANVRCNNGGVCMLGGLVPYCNCPQGYIGRFCEAKQDPCANLKCNNGGLCQLRGGVPYCQCLEQFSGQFCDIKTDPCLNVRCNNGGRCLSRGLEALCECSPGFHGGFCDNRIVTHPCLNYRCENGAQCLALGTHPYCECLPGYTGLRCEARIDTRDYPYLVCNSTCSTQTSCRMCLPCSTCRAEPMCLENYKLVKDLDGECQACGYLEALLIRTNQGPIGYSPLKCQSSQNCPLGSACVEDGKGSGTCCRNKVGPNYVDNKPGTCPLGTGLSCGGVGCQRDSDCAGNLKCCRSCGNQCVSPVLPFNDVCNSCSRGTVCATVDRCLPGSTSCPVQTRPLCVTDSCGGCGSGEKCKIVFNDRLCRSDQDCDHYVYKCVPTQVTTCSSSCGVGTACTAVGKCCLVQGNKECDSLYRCQNIRQCSQCREGLFCRDSLVKCVGSSCPQNYECVDPCGGCPSGRVCRLNVLTGGSRYECMSQTPCGGCSAGLVCRDVQTVCNDAYCVQQQCVIPKDDKCGGCPAGLSCQYISTGCPTSQCAPPTFRCVAGIAPGQCPYVPPSYSLEVVSCRGSIDGRVCTRDSDCYIATERCCPDSCGRAVCKRVHWVK